MSISVLDYFERNVELTPNHPAVILENGKVYSYQILNILASEIGREVASAVHHGIPLTEGDDTIPLVAVMLTRGIGLIAAILGVLKSGSAYVPIDPAFPPDRQTYIFGQAKCQLLITDAECFEQALSLGVQVPPTLVLNTTVMQPHGIVGHIVERSLHLSPIENHHKQSILDAGRAKVITRKDGGLMYVLYTSGSTGKPKGVMIKHAGVTSQMMWFRDELQVGPHSRILGLATICFDISVLEMYLPLVSGGTLVYVDQCTQKDPFQLVEIMEKYNVTVFQATPTTYDMLFAIGWKGDPKVDFLVGGEAFRPSLCSLASTGKSLRNIYGPTETTIWASSFLVPRDVNRTLQFVNGMPVVPIGMPIRGMYFLVVDLDTISEYSTSSLTTQRPQLVTNGTQEGELWIGGIGVGLGYLNRPDLTEAVYLPNPFGEGMIYRTGDLVKRLENGNGPYHFIRRIDNQVKVDGFRIELSEIEYVFLTHPMVQQCVVLLKKNVLVLYVKNRRHLSEENPWLNRHEILEIKNHAARSLTYYMIPKVVVQVKKFEETPSGKINRNVLPEPDDVEPHLVDYSGIGGASTIGGDGEEKGTEALPKDEVDEVDIREKQSKPDHLRIPQPTHNLHPSIPHNGIPHNGNTKHGNHKNGEKHTAGGRALTKHILDIIERVRGQRPTAKSSFATIGVDSLGAVMFIKQLSDSLGGHRVQPKDLYKPGVTIGSFAQELYNKLSLENPSLLDRLGLTIGAQSSLMGEPEQQQIEQGIISTESEQQYPGNDVEEEEEEEIEDYLGQSLVLECEASFEELLNSSRVLMEGFRGLFIFLVLYDHFHSPKEDPIGNTFMVDTYLFVMISGITTTLQLRETPRFRITPSSPSSPSSLEQQPLQPLLSSGKEHGEKMTVTNPSTRGYYELLPRKGFNLTQFMISRLVGLYPILWLSLALFTPVWLQDDADPKRGTHMTKNICSVLYIVGMQQWWRPQCQVNGPNMVLYASLIINIFLIYGIGRKWIIEPIQQYLMSWGSLLVHPVTLQPPPEMLANRTWKQWIGDTMVLIAYNRVDSSMISGVLLFWFISMWFFGNLMRYYTFAKNCLPFIPYFMMGLFFAAALESFHFALWDNHRRRRNGEKDIWRNELKSGSRVGLETGRGLESIRGVETGRGVDNDNSSLSSCSSTSVLLDVPLLRDQSSRGNNQSSQHYPLTHSVETAAHHNHNHNHNSINNQSTHTTTTAPTSSCTYAVEEVYEFVYRAFNVSDDGAMQFPWIYDEKRHWWLSWIYQSAPPLTPTEYSFNGPYHCILQGDGQSQDTGLVPVTQSSAMESGQRLGPSAQGPGLGTASEPGSSRSHCEGVTWEVKMTHYVIRFFPDGMAVIWICVMTKLVTDAGTQDWLWFVGLPTMFFAMLFVMMLQKGSARLNITRFVLESRPVRTMGYASYAMYLFQRMIFTFYFPLIIVGSQLKPRHYGMDIGNGDPWKGGPWFEQLPVGYKFLSFWFLVLLCWATHHYVQDMFVGWLYAKVAGRCRRPPPQNH